jgi:hypothetical protein
MSRKLCEKCLKRPTAINYYKNKKPYYRKKCDYCLRHPDRDEGKTNWARSGYKMKPYCEKCGYKSRHTEQFNVFHIDRDLTNCKHKNLKTVCANCQRILHKEDIKWKQGDLIPDVI